MSKDAETIKAELSKPFAPEDLEWRLQQSFDLVASNRRELAGSMEDEPSKDDLDEDAEGDEFDEEPEEE